MRNPKAPSTRAGSASGAPTGAARRRGTVREVRESAVVVGAREQRLGGSLGQVGHQGCMVGNSFDVVAGLLQRRRDRRDALRRVEPHRVAAAARLAGVIREHAGEAAPDRGVLRSRAQASARSATWATRSGSGRCRTGENSCAASGGPTSLNDRTPPSRRPSTSGSTTFMARSAAPRPRVLPAQASRALPD